MYHWHGNIQFKITVTYLFTNYNSFILSGATHTGYHAVGLFFPVTDRSNSAVHPSTNQTYTDTHTLSWAVKSVGA